MFQNVFSICFCIAGLVQEYGSLPLIDSHNHNVIHWTSSEKQLLKMWENRSVDKIVLFGRTSKFWATLDDEVAWRAYIKNPDIQPSPNSKRQTESTHFFIKIRLFDAYLYRSSSLFYNGGKTIEGRNDRANQKKRPIQRRHMPMYGRDEG